MGSRCKRLPGVRHIYFQMKLVSLCKRPGFSGLGFLIGKVVTVVALPVCCQTNLK